MVNQSQHSDTTLRTISSEDQRTLTLEEQLTLLSSTAKVIRHEIANLPDDKGIQREVSMIKVAGRLFCDFLDGRCDRIQSQIDGANNE